MRWGKRIIATAALTAAALALPATAAFAHECFVANRSAKGAAGAAHSQRWFTFTLEQAFDEFLGVPEANIDDALAEAAAAGLKDAYSLYEGPTLAEGTGAQERGILSNGKGLDHFFSSPVGAQIIGIALKYGGSLEEEE